MHDLKHIYDKDGNRVIKCYICNRLKKTDEFVIYGGKDSVNSGLCRKCAIKKGYLK